MVLQLEGFYSTTTDSLPQLGATANDTIAIFRVAGVWTGWGRSDNIANTKNTEILNGFSILRSIDLKVTMVCLVMGSVYRRRDRVSEWVGVLWAMMRRD